MSATIISTENLSKCYRIHHESKSAPRRGYRRLSEEILAYPKKLLSRLGQWGSADGTDEEFWALKDLCFEVQSGEVIGVIGRNGAGKSTLLKVLSRITEPSSGRVTLRGRVASLLEVGTGFHPELTGRENIFLNGAILGMRREEIRRKFDEIVEFGEVEKFLDTPVKRYSSGMYVRLAFAVAAHLEPEILIVDEVLAVGDSQFQDKCLGKMKQVSRSGGRTVLFVSHNMGAIQSLCSRALLLEKGKLVYDGDCDTAVKRYVSNNRARSSVNDMTGLNRTGTREAEILSMQFEDCQGNLTSTFRMGEPLVARIQVRFHRPALNPTCGLLITLDTGMRVADCRSTHSDLVVGLSEDIVEFKMTIPNLTLYPRTYLVEPWISDEKAMSDYDWVHAAASFEVTSGPKFLNGVNVTSQNGITFVPTEWSSSAVALQPTCQVH